MHLLERQPCSVWSDTGILEVEVEALSEPTLGQGHLIWGAGDFEEPRIGGESSLAGAVAPHGAQKLNPGLLKT